MYGGSAACRPESGLQRGKEAAELCERAAGWAQRAGACGAVPDVSLCPHGAGGTGSTSGAFEVCCRSGVLCGTGCAPADIFRGCGLGGSGSVGSGWHISLRRSHCVRLSRQRCAEALHSVLHGGQKGFVCPCAYLQPFRFGDAGSSHRLPGGARCGGGSGCQTGHGLYGPVRIFQSGNCDLRLFVGEPAGPANKIPQNVHPGGRAGLSLGQWPWGILCL